MKSSSLKIIFILLGIYAIFFSLWFLFAQNSLENILKQSIYENHQEVAKTISQEVDRYLYEKMIDLENVAHSEVFESALEGALDSGAIGHGSDLLDKRVNDFSRFSGPWNFMLVVDTRGTIQIAVDKNKIGKNIVNDPVLALALEKALNKENYYSDVVKFEDLAAPSLVFSAPIIDEESEDKRVVGAVIAGFYWPSIMSILEDAKWPLLVNIYNKEGYLIASNKSELQKKILIESHKNKEFFQYVSSPLHFSLMPSVLDGREALSSVAQERGYNLYRGNSWVFLLERPAEVAFLEVESIIWKIFYFSILILSLAFVITMLLLNYYLVSPLNNLNRIAKKIIAGNFEERANEGKKDEFGALARNFNIVLDALKRSREEVNIKVEEQTKSIEEKMQLLENQGRAILNILEDAEMEKLNLEKEKNKSNTILQGIGDGVFVVDADLNILVFNVVAEKLSGLKAEDVIGHKYDEVLNFVYEDKPDKKDDFVERAIKTGVISKMSPHTILLRKDGRKLSVADSAAPLKDRHGKTTGCAVVFRDATLERQIDRAKTEFVSLASHQLRTPLTASNWYVEMLLSGDAGNLNEKQSEYLKEVYSSNRRLVTLVNSLLNVSRIELGTLAIDVEPTDFSEIGLAVIKNLELNVKNKKITLEHSFASNLPKIMADPKLVYVVFENLLSNAVKYTPEEGRIDFSIKSQHGFIRVEVKDNGYGIPASQHDKVFSKLFRADNIVHLDVDGTGLGLYIVKSIMDVAHGRIWFESEENKGTTFFLDFPESGMEAKAGTRKLS